MAPFIDARNSTSAAVGDPTVPFRSKAALRLDLVHPLPIRQRLIPTDDRAQGVGRQ